MPHRRQPLAITLLAALTLCGLALPARGQLPQTKLYSVSPAGGQIGATFDLTITSAADSEGARQLIFSHPGITAQPKMDNAGGLLKTAVPVPNQFTVAIAKDVPPGVYDIRMAGVFGISNARSFIVGDMAEAMEPADNSSPSTAAPLPLNSVVNGTANARGFDHFKLALTRGQRVLIEARGETIDSRMVAVIALHSPQGRELDRQRSTRRTEALIDYTAEADGEYLLTVHDLVYDGGPQHFYRLSVRNGPYIDYIFPPSGQPGTKGTYTLFGRNLPGGQKTDQVAPDGRPLESLAVQIEIPADARAAGLQIDTIAMPAEAVTDAIVYRFNSPQGASNPVRLGIARAPVVAEAEPNDAPEKATKVTLPAEVVGRFTPRSDRDWIEFTATKGQVIDIELLSDRIGVPTDAALVIQQIKTGDKGEVSIKDVAAADDMGEGKKSGPKKGGEDFSLETDDPSATFTAAEDGVYRVMVRDQFSSGRPDPARVYRLAIAPVVKGGDQGDFRLVAVAKTTGDGKDNNKKDTGATVLRRGGSEEIVLLLDRRAGFEGAVEVTAEGLPAGITAAPVVLPPGAETGSMVFHAGENADFWAGLVRIVAKAKIDGKEVTRHARGGQLVWGSTQDKFRGWSRITEGVGVAVIDAETMPYSVVFAENKVWDAQRAGKVNVPVKVARRGDFKGAVKLTVAGGNNAPVSGKEVTIAADKNDGVIELEVKNTATAPGYTVLVTSSAQVNYGRNPKAVEALTQQKDELAAAVKELTEMAKTAKDDKKKEIEAKIKQAQDMLKTLEADAKKMADGAKPKQMNVVQPVGAVTVNVAEPPAKEKK